MNINFFRQDAITVAKYLLGKYLVRRYDNKEIVTKIVETTGIYTLHCLPNKEAAIICNKAISK